MTSLEAYKTFLLKINKNDTNRNINISKGNFVLIYNEQKDIWLSKRLSKDNDSSDKNQLEALLVPDKEIEKVKDTKNYAVFELPKDLFQYETSFSIAEKGHCKDRVLYNWDFKAKNKNVLFQDENNNPSFEYEETLINLSEGNIIVYKTDFDITKQYITYYKQPEAIDIEGYRRVDGSLSKEINPTVSDYIVNQIINHCAIEVIRSYENPEGFALAKDRLNEQ